jgi:hypothetical protein
MKLKEQPYVLGSGFWVRLNINWHYGIWVKIGQKFIITDQEASPLVGIVQGQ